MTLLFIKKLLYFIICVKDDPSKVFEVSYLFEDKNDVDVIVTLT